MQLFTKFIENTMDPITLYIYTLVGETQFEETWGITPVLKFNDGPDNRSLFYPDLPCG